MSMNMSQNKTHVSGVRHGTPLYISPEILRNGKASKAADVYSFGVIMWELMHGTLAWNQLLQVREIKGGKGGGGEKGGACFSVLLLLAQL